LDLYEAGIGGVAKFHNCVRRGRLLREIRSELSMNSLGANKEQSGSSENKQGLPVELGFAE
jgi:hypothetical protein